MEVEEVLVAKAPTDVEQVKEIVTQLMTASQSPSPAPHWLELVQQVPPPLPSEQSVTVRMITIMNKK